MENKMETKVKVGDNEITICVVKPTNAVVREADTLRTKVWHNCLTDGIPTRKQVVELLRDRGEWDDEKEKKEELLTIQLTQLEKDLALGRGGKRKPKVSEGRDIAIEIRKVRLELRDLISERISLEDNSAENLADNARFDYLVAHCTYYDNGQRVYKSFDEYNNKSADDLAFAAAGLLGKMLYNLDSNFEKNLPENKFLSTYGLVNDDLALIDPNEGFTVDLDGRRIDEEGYYVDDEGHRTDQDGNRLDETGNYEYSEYVNDLITPKKRTTKPKVEKETTES